MRSTSRRPRSRPARRGLLLITLTAGACDTCSPDPDRPKLDVCPRSSPYEPVCPCGDGTQKPFRADWELVVDAEFPLTGDDAVRSLSLGHLEHEGNWGNRGDIEVLFDLPEERVTIELRRYAHAECEADAELLFENMYLWAATTETPTLFKELGDESCLPLVEDRGKTLPDDATDGQLRWRDDCRVYYYYDGQSSPRRAGADLRVHLPAAYRGRLDAVTEDNDVEDDYPLRGDIDLYGLCGSAALRLSSGQARVKLCDDLSPAPTCTTKQIEACAAAGWDPACGCEEFGTLDVRANPATGPDITIDLPDALFARVSVDNEQEGAVAGEPTSCDVRVENCAEGCELTQDPETPWTAQVVYNDPGPPATEEAGYRVTALAERCQLVTELEGPDEWIDGAPPEPTRRGFARLCTGCL